MPRKTTPPLGLTQVVVSGDRRASLEALRDRLAVCIEDPGTHPRDLAALVRQLSSVMREIVEIDRLAPKEVSAVDDLAARRRARRAAPPDSEATAGG